MIRLDSHGTPLVLGALVGGLGYGTCALRWSDSTWVVAAELGHGVDPIHQVLSRDTNDGLVWTTADDIDVPGVGLQHYLVMSGFDGVGFGAPDTVDRIYAGWWKYAGATSGRRRWVVAHDSPGPRIWYSDTAHVWHKRELTWWDAGDRGVAVAPLDDTTAMAVMAGRGSSLRWSLLQGDTWVSGDLVPGPDEHGGPLGPCLRLSPSGALWLGWSTEYPNVQLATWRDGTWRYAGRLECTAKPVPGYYMSKNFRLSRDDWELPVVLWFEHNTDAGFTGSAYVSVPSDSGYPAGEYVPDSWGGDYGDVVRDRNGDVWVVWETETDGMFWTHSYTRATCSAPEVRRYQHGLLVTARLSEPAPETWWAVERAREGEPFTEVARVRVTDSTRVAWLDDSRPHGPVRYRFRRECLDTRYQWWSPETAWPQCRLVTLLLRLREWLGQGLLVFEVEGATPGPLEVTLYDVAGRRVLKRSATVDPNGQLSYQLDLNAVDRRIGSGVYFLSVRDASGERAEAAKIVVLR